MYKQCKQKPKIDFRKGSGTYITFTVCIVGLFIFISIAIVFTRLSICNTRVNEALNVIGRKIIIEDSMDDARETANRLLDELLDDKIFEPSSKEIEIRYAMNTEKWKKGGFIEIIIGARGKSGIGRFLNSTLMMIE